MESNENQRKEEAKEIIQFNLGYNVEGYLDEGGLSWVYKVSKGGKLYAVKIIDKFKYCKILSIISVRYSEMIR